MCEYFHKLKYQSVSQSIFLPVSLLVCQSVGWSVSQLVWSVNPSTSETCIVQFQKISILPPEKGLEFPGGWGDSGRSKNIKKCMKLYRNFQRGGEVLKKIPSVGEVWIFSGTTH